MLELSPKTNLLEENDYRYSLQDVKDPVLSHGDFCLPNIFIEDGKVSGLIDLGDTGVNDKWLDIALCYRSLKHNADGTWGKKIYEDVNPDLLLVDEVLSVGDTNFQKKCMRKITKLKERGVSFLFVSHSIEQVRSLCEKTLWIEGSQIMAYGDSNEVCQKYLDYCNSIVPNN